MTTEKVALNIKKKKIPYERESDNVKNGHMLLNHLGKMAENNSNKTSMKNLRGIAGLLDDLESKHSATHITANKDLSDDRISSTALAKHTACLRQYITKKVNTKIPLSLKKMIQEIQLSKLFFEKTKENMLEGKTFHSRLEDILKMCISLRSKLEPNRIFEHANSLLKSLKNFSLCENLIDSCIYLFKGDNEATMGLISCMYNDEICISRLMFLALLWRLVYLYSFYSYMLIGSLKSKNVKGRNWFSRWFRMNVVTAEYFEDALRESVRIHAQLSFTHIHTSDNRIPTAVPIYVDSFIYRKDR